MTGGEACQLVVAVTVELSEVRRERDAFRLLAVQGIHYCHDLQRELLTMEARYHRTIEENRRLRAATMTNDDRRAA